MTQKIFMFDGIDFYEVEPESTAVLIIGEETPLKHRAAASNIGEMLAALKEVFHRNSRHGHVILMGREAEVQRPWLDYDGPSDTDVVYTSYARVRIRNHR